MAQGSPLSSWIQAARPLAQGNIFVPLLLGQGLAYGYCAAFSWKRFALVHLFGVLVHLFIIFANDAADWRGDVMNKTFNVFSGGSRVVPEGKLTPRQLAYAALAMAATLGVFGLVTSFALRLPFMLVLVTFPLSLLWAYSFPPLRLSYRGGGEWLQGLGLGLVLPLIGFYLQCGDFLPSMIKTLIPAVLLGWAGNVVTALPDAPADRQAQKRTYPVRHTQRRARRDALLVIAGAVIATPWVIPRATTATYAVIISAPLALLAAALPLVRSADATRPQECLRFVVLAAAAISVAQVAWAVAGFLAAPSP